MGTARLVLPVGRLFGVLAAVAVGCADDTADLSGRGPRGSSTSSANGGTPGLVGPDGLTPEERLFRGLEPDLQKKCGGACHTEGTSRPEPPIFLGPEAYKAIKAHPGIVVPDTYQSALLTKGPHAGPAMSADPELEKKVVEWLNAEALLIQSQKKPTTEPVAIVGGANDLDLSSACIGGLSGVHLKFDAALVGGMLSLSNLKLAVPTGTDVHILKPRLVRISGSGRDLKETADPANTFENVDQTVPGGQETVLSTGSALFSGDGFHPFDLGADRIRIEIDKLEPGKVNVVEKPKTCKNPAGFVATVLPSMRGQAGGFNLNCASCHGGGLAGMSLGSNDADLVCNQVLQKLKEGDLGNSIIVTKVTTGPHNGGTINNATAWRDLWVNNAGLFF